MNEDVGPSSSEAKEKTCKYIRVTLNEPYPANVTRTHQGSVHHAKTSHSHYTHMGPHTRHGEHYEEVGDVRPERAVYRARGNDARHCMGCVKA